MIIWELDFYSRPLLDEQKKKVWEVLICESPLTIDREPATLFRYAQFCSNAQVNSAWLGEAITTAIAQAGHKPDRIRFFRQAMANMITKACDDLALPSQLSRRTLALNQWIQERMAVVYPEMAGYQPGSTPAVVFPSNKPQRLPDALRGEKWDIVSLEAAAFADMAEWAIDFGEAFPLSLAALKPETPIPGMRIFSSRALPLAGWMAGLEMAAIQLEASSPPRLLLETGVSDSWVLAVLNRAPLETEARQFEAAKQKANGVHFLAVQTDPEADRFAGFWLLQEINLA